MLDSDFLKQLATVIAGILYIVAVIPYLISLLKKQIRPHPVSWFLWSVIGLVNLIFYTQTGATYTQLIAYTSFFIPLAIFIFSTKVWEKSFSKIDYICLGVSLVSLILGLVYKSPVLGLTLNILLSDFVAFVPTIIKTYKDPKSENTATWFITVIANIITIVLINEWTFAIALLPIYTCVMNGVVLFESLQKQKKMTT